MICEYKERVKNCENVPNDMYWDICEPCAFHKFEKQPKECGLLIDTFNLFGNPYGLVYIGKSENSKIYNELWREKKTQHNVTCENPLSDRYGMCEQCSLKNTIYLGSFKLCVARDAGNNGVMCLREAAIINNVYVLCIECNTYREKCYQTYKDYSHLQYFPFDPINMVTNQLSLRYNYNILFRLPHCDGHKQYEDQLLDISEQHWATTITLEPELKKSFFEIMVDKRDRNVARREEYCKYTSLTIEGIDIDRPRNHTHRQYKRPATNVLPTEYTIESDDSHLMCENCQKRRIAYIKNVHTLFLEDFKNQQENSFTEQKPVAYCPLYDDEYMPYDYEGAYFADPFAGFYNETTKATLPMPEYLNLHLVKPHQQKVYLTEKKKCYYDNFQFPLLVSYEKRIDVEQYSNFSADNYPTNNEDQDMEESWD